MLDWLIARTLVNSRLGLLKGLGDIVIAPGKSGWLVSQMLGNGSASKSGI